MPVCHQAGLVRSFILRAYYDIVYVCVEYTVYTVMVTRNSCQYHYCVCLLQAFGKDAGTVYADPQFVSPSTGDWVDLLPSSPALPLGFVPIDVSHVGPLRPVGAPV